jgi:hypothetical protein
MVTSFLPAAAEGGDPPIRVVVTIEASRRIPAGEAARLERWLKARMPQAEVDLVIGRRYGS